MLRSAAFVAIPGALGALGLFHQGQGEPVGREPRLAAYAIKVGVTFPEAAVREALPEGFEPAPGFTGGIAVAAVPEDWPGSPLSTGYVWLDVTTGGASARYALIDFVAEAYRETSPVALTAAALSEVHESENGILHVITWPDRVSGLEVVVSPQAEACAPGPAGQDAVLTSHPDGSLGVIQGPVGTDWCIAEAEVAWANITAPPGHVLRPFVPQHVLWAQIAVPPGERRPVPR